MDRKLLILAVLGILGIIAVSGCTSYNNTTNNSSMGNMGNNSSASTSTSNMVTIQNFAFNPATTTIKVGTKVTWTNQDSTTHHVVSDTGAFDSGDLNNGQSYSFTFTKAGNYPYHCSIHPSMTGTIIVK